MLEKDKLRKADVFSGIAIFLFGAWIVWQASKMPMKDSWGGVQNVWFVSPALFPLFIGAVIMLLGLLLSRTALKTIGMKTFGDTLKWLFSKKLFRFLNTMPVLRFYAMAVLFLAFIFLNLPQIDFFLSAVLFLSVFITLFYFGEAALLKKLFFFYLAGTVFFIIYFATGLNGLLSQVLPFANDFLALAFILAYCLYAWILIRGNPELHKKFRIGLIVSVAAPFIVGPIFKYFLLVPMPTEGLVVAILDAIWYFEF
ncbi:MAG: hypothetical protein V2I56_25365 [Desulfobacteraceae bacterium]|nr:hypothetical protein [Desulfobacteraceae bacterium]